MSDIKLPEEGDPEPGYAVTSTTETTPHPADESSSPGPYRGLSPERPPVSTTKPNVPIAHALVGGAGEGNTGQPDPEPEQQQQQAKTKKD